MATHNNAIMRGDEAQTDAGDWTWQTRAAAAEGEARVLFRQVERALDAVEPAPATQETQRRRTIRALGEECLADGRARGKEARRLEQRESRLNAHILPTIGDVRVAMWRQTRQVNARARPTTLAPCHRLPQLCHHAATRWFHQELGEEWETVAMYLGDKLTTVMAHYIRPGDEARKNTVNKLNIY